MKRREQGFTLVELLAALVAGSFLLVAIGWSLSSLIRLLPDDAAEARARHLAALAPRLEAMLEQMSPIGFAGEAKRLSAGVPPPMAAGPVGPVQMTLSVRREAEGESLHARFEPVARDVRWPAAAREQRLLGGFRSIRFQFERAEGTVERALPRLVTLSLDDGTRVRRISASPRLDSDGSCRFDPVSMTCRP
jgi:prepilin-type N-terminal cleavage/methylation domain-containing protein